MNKKLGRFTNTLAYFAPLSPMKKRVWWPWQQIEEPEDFKSVPDFKNWFIFSSEIDLFSSKKWSIYHQKLIFFIQNGSFSFKMDLFHQKLIYFSSKNWSIFTSKKLMYFSSKIDIFFIKKLIYFYIEKIDLFFIEKIELFFIKKIDLFLHRKNWSIFHQKLIYFSSKIDLFFIKNWSIFHQK